MVLPTPSIHTRYWDQVEQQLKAFGFENKASQMVVCLMGMIDFPDCVNVDNVEKCNEKRFEAFNRFQIFVDSFVKDFRERFLKKSEV